MATATKTKTKKELVAEAAKAAGGIDEVEDQVDETEEDETEDDDKPKYPRWYTPKGIAEAVVDCTDLGWGRITISEPSMYRLSQVRIFSKKHDDHMHPDAMGEQVRAYVDEVEVLDGDGYERAKAAPTKNAKHEDWVAFYRRLPMRVFSRLDMAGAVLTSDGDVAGN